MPVTWEQFVEVYRVTNGVNLFLVNIQAHQGLVRSTEFPRGRIDLYAGGGSGVTMPFTKSVIAGESRGSTSWGVWPPSFWQGSRGVCPHAGTCPSSTSSRPPPSMVKWLVEIASRGYTRTILWSD